MPWKVLSKLSLPAPGKAFDTALQMSFSPAVAPMRFQPPGGSNAEKIHDILDSAENSRPFDFLGSGLSAFRFAVCTLRARVFALDSCLRDTKLSMSDLAILEDLVSRGVPVTEDRILQNEDLEKAMRRRAGLLRACRSLRDSVPADLRALANEGDVLAIANYSALHFPDSRCDDLWSLVLFLDFTLMLLLGMDPRTWPRQSADGWNAQFALTPSYLESVAIAQNMAAYAPQRTRSKVPLVSRRLSLPRGSRPRVSSPALRNGFDYCSLLMLRTSLLRGSCCRMLVLASKPAGRGAGTRCMKWLKCRSPQRSSERLALRTRTRLLDFGLFPLGSIERVWSSFVGPFFLLCCFLNITCSGTCRVQSGIL